MIMSDVGEKGDQHDLHNGAERGDLPAQAGWHNAFDRLDLSSCLLRQQAGAYFL